MKTNNEFSNIVIPKGENRQAAITWLTQQGVEVPAFKPRCLHCI